MIRKIDKNSIGKALRAAYDHCKNDAGGKTYVNYATGEGDNGNAIGKSPEIEVRTMVMDPITGIHYQLYNGYGENMWRPSDRISLQEACTVAYRLISNGGNTWLDRGTVTVPEYEYSISEQAKYFVLESCEFQRHFLAYHPDYSIITNIELDHVDYYKDMDDYLNAFQSFVSQTKKHCVVFGDDPHLRHLKYSTPVSTYGLGPDNDYRATHIEQGPFGMRFDCEYHGKRIAHIELSEVGDPFLQDALGCFALCHVLGMPVENIVQGLKDYKGIARRFVIEEVKDSVLIDDYAHHPTAVRYMIDSARKKYPNHKIVALYKPDRYSRLQYFLDDFAQSLNTADQVVLCDFPKNAVREDSSITVTIQDLLDLCPGSLLLDIDETSAKILKEMGPAVYVFMSSKDIYLLKDMLCKEIESSDSL